MQLASLCAWTATLVGFASCEKAGPTASGKLTQNESTLMAYLPKQTDVVFGGNFMRLQQLFSRAPIAKARELSEAPAMKAWTDCFLKHESVNMIGSFGVSNSVVEVRFVMTGIKIDDVAHCAKATGFPSKLDADRKFLAVDVVGPQGPAPQGYLVVPDGVYSTMSVGFGGGSAVVTPPDRAAFEAALAEVADDNASRNPGLQAMIARADRTKAMWFAGSAASTPIGDKVGELFGSLDFASGFDADVTVEVTSADLAAEIVDGLADAKSAAGLLGVEVKSVVDAIELKRTGDRLRFTLKLSNQQLDTLFTKLGPLMRKGI
jgi:hypothetical protein